MKDDKKGKKEAKKDDGKGAKKTKKPILRIHPKKEAAAPTGGGDHAKLQSEHNVLEKKEKEEVKEIKEVKEVKEVKEIKEVKEVKKEPKKEEPEESKPVQTESVKFKEKPKEEAPKPSSSTSSKPQSHIKKKSEIRPARNTETAMSTNFDSIDLSDIKDPVKLIAALKKENIDLKKKCEGLDKQNNELLDEVESCQNELDKFLKEKDEMEKNELASSKAINELKECKRENEELKQKISSLEEDSEIINEELATKELELEIANKNFEEYKAKIEQEKSEGKIPNNEEKKQSPPPKQTSNEPTEMTPEMEEQLLQMEEMISDLSEKLKNTAEERDYAINYYKQEIEKEKEKMEKLKIENQIIPKKDDLIKQLTDKLKDQDAIIESLKSQITALSPANDMYEEIIIEKDELEGKLEELKEENQKLKDDLQNDEEMIADLDSALKISEQVMKQSQDEALAAQNDKKEMEKKVESLNENEKTLIDKINQLKEVNNIYKEELSHYKDTNVDLDEVLNNNLTTSSKIKSLQRQKILYYLSNIDVDKFLLRNKIIDSMIPKKMFETGNLDTFDKFLNIQCLRKKTLELIYNVIENDLLNDDITNEKHNEIEPIEGENLKKFVIFYGNVLNALIDYYCILYKFEIYLSKLDSEKFIEFSKNEQFISVYSNIIAGSQIIDKLIYLIKTDSFNIQFQSNVDGLKIIINTANTQIKIMDINDLDNLYDYETNLLGYYIKLSVIFGMERLDILIKKTDSNTHLICDVSKNLISGYKNIKKMLTKVHEKFFNTLSYDLSNQIFDVESSYYTKLIDMFTKLKEDPDGVSASYDTYVNKYSGLTDYSNKLCVVLNSSLEKFEEYRSKTEDNKNLENQENENNLPIPSWSELTGQLSKELESIAKMKDNLDDALKKLKQEKIEKAAVESKFDELNRAKQLNESKLAELTVKVGKVSQLESANEEYSKKIEKYKIAVEGLQKSAEDSNNKYKDLKEKYDELSLKKAATLEKKNRLPGIGDNIGPFSLGGVGNLAPILNTVCELQKERKFLKSKIMKDKLKDLINDNQSYMNQFIKNDLKITKKFDEKDFYRNIENQVKNLNNNYDNLRKKLSLPKVYDISDNKSNYKLNNVKEEANLNKNRIDYMKEANSILFNLFGDNTSDKILKDLIDHDISRTINQYGEYKIPVGKIRIMENDQKQSNDNKNVSTIPLIISEESLKLLNKTFIY